MTAARNGAHSGFDWVIETSKLLDEARQSFVISHLNVGHFGSPTEIESTSFGELFEVGAKRESVAELHRRDLTAPGDASRLDARYWMRRRIVMLLAKGSLEIEREALGSWRRHCLQLAREF